MDYTSYLCRVVRTSAPIGYCFPALVALTGGIMSIIAEGAGDDSLDGGPGSRVSSQWFVAR
jgi:hypothetical protein